jgi:predicted transcriptional regulator
VETALAKAFLVYGPLGLICIIMLLIAWRLYRDLTTERASHTKEMNTERERHAQEMRELEERYITKAETWMDKNHELAKSINQVLDSVSRRYEGRR